jgi:hypothetical protein
MNSEEERKKPEKTENKNEGKSGDEFVKVTISKRAETASATLLTKINDGFEGGRVSRQDLISWVLTRFAEECSEPDIRAIRADHFDEIALLELCLKKSKQAGSLPSDLRKLLLAQAGLDDTTKKATKKSVDIKVNQ